MERGVDVSAVLPGLLKKRGWTQEELARAAQITRNDINAMANGRLRAGRARLQRIADALEVSVLELGAPEEEADDRGRDLLDRLAAVEAELAAERRRFDRFVRATTGRLAALEGAQATPARRSARQPKGGAAR